VFAQPAVQMGLQSRIEKANIVPHPPPLPPWDIQGEITDRVSSMSIDGVEADILANGALQASARTDALGRFDLRLAQPKPATIEVRIRKDGYEGEPALKVPSDQPWNMDLTKLPCCIKRGKFTE